MRFDIFGTLLSVEKKETGWQAFYLGNEGKKRPANDILIPGDLHSDELLAYLDDLFHERATPERPRVVQIA